MDAMKAIAALGVILVHFPFPGVLGKLSALLVGLTAQKKTARAQ